MMFFSHPRTVIGWCVLIGIGAGPARLISSEPSPSTSPQKEQNGMDASTKHKHTNRLIHTTSPYLLQHAHNPVEWYEWGQEALEEAKKQDMPIFLSIGYAACHWCHVMEHESFEDEEVAAALREGFISIKVDREERPDIDAIYMAYTQKTTGGGGWPMSVWLTPDGTPFHAGTYFPKQSFLGMLKQIHSLWVNEREQLLTLSQSARDFFSEWSAGSEPAEGVLPKSSVDASAKKLATYFDPTYGGFRSSRNKFPPSMAMDLLLRVYRRNGNGDLVEAVETTLDHMGRGGIYDHIGGGICRYSTDPEWLVPHFEKMLYDQAMVSAIYLDAHQVSRNPFYASVATDIFEYVMEDLQSPEGGFYSSRDADSEGLEGKFYLWTVEQITQALGQEDGALFCKYYDVTKRGNWFESRGHAPAGPKNILHVTQPPEVFAKSQGLDVVQFRGKLQAWRGKLRTIRDGRVAPKLDDKILSGWNGLMIASLAKGARVLNEPKFAEAAARAADFVLTKLRTQDGRLLRTYRMGQSRLTGYLDDYAFMTEGLLNLYEATFDPRWLDEAVKLTDTLIEYYFDEKGGGFFFTANDGEKLVARSKDPQDGAIPAGNSIQAQNLLRLAVLFDRKDYRQKAESILRAFATMAVRSPSAFERLYCAADLYHDRVKEIAIIGDPALPATQALVRTVFERYLPNKVVVHAPEKLNETNMPLLKGRSRVKGLPTAYVCENYRCQLPVTSPAELAKALDAK